MACGVQPAHLWAHLLQWTTRNVNSTGRTTSMWRTEIGLNQPACIACLERHPHAHRPRAERCPPRVVIVCTPNVALQTPLPRPQAAAIQQCATETNSASPLTAHNLQLLLLLLMRPAAPLAPLSPSAPYPLASKHLHTPHNIPYMQYSPPLLAGLLRFPPPPATSLGHRNPKCSSAATPECAALLLLLPSAAVPTGPPCRSPRV